MILRGAELVDQVGAGLFRPLNPLPLTHGAGDPAVCHVDDLEPAGRAELDALRLARLRVDPVLEAPPAQGGEDVREPALELVEALALSDRRRRKSRWRLGDQSETPVDDAEDQVHETDPSLPLERTERDERIQAALNTLAPEHRAVVVMKEFDGLRYVEDVIESKAVSADPTPSVVIAASGMCEAGRVLHHLRAMQMRAESSTAKGRENPAREVHASIQAKIGPGHNFEP